MLDSLWLESNGLHVAAQLGRHLSEDLSCKVSLGHRFFEGYKLNDIALASVAFVVFKETTVTIKLIHAGEIGIAHTDDDNGAGLLGKLNDRSLGLTHIHNLTVGQDHEDLVNGLAVELVAVLKELLQ